ncbi:LAFE_0G12530g1_1 [Lachancea fermentati]|uniref:LAFE_0G12530g1_1 n=1 Tax=Lachancea fermentati TaxID=4955 RepID=A0A1G4MI01_LACFM|nr:LAFE_0G12530g1_1 [Lachancea fermentati]
MSQKEVGMLDVGTHCKFCRQLDFLPFHCSRCNGDFCQLHRLKEDHHCRWLLEHQNVEDANSAPSPKNENGRYFQSLLPEKGYIRVQQPPDSRKAASDSLRERLVKSGNTTALDKLKQFFSRNRSAHSKKTSKTSPSTKIIQLAKMKKSAVGDGKIPQDNRIYIFCYVVDRSDEHVKHELFINKIWPVGRVLDYIASQFDIQNYNNRAESTTKEKLFLYLDNNGVPTPIDTTSRVATTIKNMDTLFLVRGEQAPSS